MPEEIYTQGTYLDMNPTWHIEDSPWKAKQIIQMMQRNNIVPKTVCDVGCGAGEILYQLQLHTENTCTFWGYEISPQAFKFCEARANETLHFKLGDIAQEHGSFDVILIIDVIEHIEDYFSFLREVRTKGDYKVFHIPLDLSILAVLRSQSILRSRSRVGHIHYFTKEIALQALIDTGYQIVDYFYTDTSTSLPADSVKSRIARSARELAFTVHKDLAVRIMRGYSLLVLAK